MQEFDSLRSAMTEVGITPPEHFEFDGRIHRFSTNGKRGDTAGWYVAFDGEIAAGAFGCYRLGISENWCSKKRTELTPEQRAEYEKRVEEAKKKREAEVKEGYKLAAEKAAVIWEGALPATSHPYLDAKQVQSHGLRVGRWTKADQETGEIYLDLPDALFVPIMDGKKLASLQAIYPCEISGRNKDFLRGGKLKGCFFAIGEKPADSRAMIYVCEGYSTGATIHEVTGSLVFCAFAANNLPAVVERVRKAFPQACIVVAADNDQWGSANTGRQYAEQCNTHVVWPEFEPDVEGKPTDFNDFMRLYGAERTREALIPATLNALNMTAEPATAEPATAEQVPAISASIPDNIDTFTPLLDVNGRGTPLSTIENLREINRRLGITIRYDVIKKEQEILIPGARFTSDNRANAALAWLTSWCCRFKMPTAQVKNYVLYLAESNLYNPVATWITSKPWDGVSRMDAFMATVTAENEALKYILMYRWMISAIAAAFSPNGVSAHGVLVFQGAQYLGKTFWFKNLVPAELRVIKDGVILKTDDKDSVKQAVSNWMCELGEIDRTMSKSDASALKAFITMDRDILRLPYAPCDSEYARRTVFFGSVNPEFFLKDPTGNRRFWTIKVTDLNPKHGLDMQQVWAEFLEEYRKGEGFYLTASEFDMLNASNENFNELDPIEEKIQRRFDWLAPELEWKYYTSTEILNAAGFDRPNKADVTKAALYIRKLNGGRSKREGQARLLLVPPVMEIYR